MCYQCFNYEALVHNPVDVCDEEYILEQIKTNEKIFDAVILSGGEFLLNKIEDIIYFVTAIRKIYNGLIIVNTNGTQPNKMKILIDQELVDGFHSDMKLPYYLLDAYEDQELIKLTVGKELNQNSIDEIIKSIEYTIQYDKGFSQIRSVKYPFMNESSFDVDRFYIERLNKKYNKNTHYYINEFIDIERI